MRFFVGLVLFAACGGTDGALQDMVAGNRCQTILVEGQPVVLTPGASLDCPCAQPTGGECSMPISCAYTIEMYGPDYPQCACECRPADAGGMRWACAC